MRPSARLRICALGAALAAAALALAACGQNGRVASPPPAVAHARWGVLPAAPVRVDAYLTTAWTGSELIVSGVCCTANDGTLLRARNVAAAYDPSASTWRRLPAPLGDIGDPVARTAVWTGREMLVWGAFKASAYDPGSNRWRLLPHAPTGHGFAVWTGREMIGWGGGCCGDAWSDGSAYDPATNSWRKLAASPLAPSQHPLAAWTGRRLIVVVSGIDPDGRPYPASRARAAAYDPRTDTWRRLPSSPPGAGGTAAWDGRELLVAGASRAASAFDPATGRWRRLAPAPSAQPATSALWTGSRLVLLDGPRGPALAYDPRTDRWSRLPKLPFAAHLDLAAVSTGHRLLVWTGAGAAAALDPITERSVR
jgi:N-acetylneuraminic acid mutarotase